MVLKKRISSLADERDDIIDNKYPSKVVEVAWCWYDSDTRHFDVLIAGAERMKADGIW